MNANVTPEQSAQFFDLKQQLRNDPAGLRQQMMAVKLFPKNLALRYMVGFFF